MRKTSKILLIFKVCFQIGKRLSDKIGLFLLYLKYPLVNRNLARYSGALRKFQTVLGGREYKIALRDNGMDMQIFISIFALGEYDLPFSFSSPSVVYDLGANIGLAAIWFSSKFPEAKFFGFEPVPENYDVAAKNYLNLSGKVFPVAAGKQKARIKMLIDVGNTGAHRLSIYGPSPVSKIKDEIEVEVDSLENLIASGVVPPPDFLKIDAEGSEVDILEGLGKFISSVTAMVIEPDAGEKEKRCKEILAKNGFRIYQTKPYLIWGLKE